MPKTQRPLSPYAADAVTLLGQLIRKARIERKLKAVDVTDRAGISRGLLRRIETGDPGCTIGADFEVGSLPAEAALESAIDFTKGCFLGQESIAKVRNLGHPQTRLVALRSDGTVARGDAVYADRSEVGTVTSAAVPDSGTILLARVRWEAADKELSTRDGGPLLRRSVSGT